MKKEVKKNINKLIQFEVKNANTLNPHYALENLLRLKTASKSDAILHFLISA